MNEKISDFEFEQFKRGKLPTLHEIPELSHADRLIGFNNIMVEELTARRNLLLGQAEGLRQQILSIKQNTKLLQHQKPASSPL